MRRQRVMRTLSASAARVVYVSASWPPGSEAEEVRVTAIQILPGHGRPSSTQRSFWVFFGAEELIFLILGKIGPIGQFLDCRPLVVGKQVAIPPSHGFSGVAHELVDDPLVDAGCSQIRGK